MKALIKFDKFYHKVMGKDSSSNSSSGNNSKKNDPALVENKSWFQKLWEQTNKSTLDAGRRRGMGVFVRVDLGAEKRSFLICLWRRYRNPSKRLHFHAFMMEAYELPD